MQSDRCTHWATSLAAVAVVVGCHSSSTQSGNGGEGGNSGGAAGMSTLPHTDSLAVESVTAAVVGIHGDDLTIAVEGTQEEVGVLLALEVTLLDKSSKVISFFDTNQDGLPDPGAGSLVLDAVPTETSFTGSGTIAKAGRLKTLSAVSVRLLSNSYRVSDAATAEVMPQPVIAEGAGCDPKGIENRCADGTGCAGAKPKCSADVLPEIDKAAYLSTPSGGTVIAVGSDSASPLASVSVEFFDAQGQPLGFDSTGSGTPEPSFVSTNGITNALAEFVWRIESTTDFVSAIPRLKLTPNDMASNSGAPVTVNLATIPERDLGDVCDTRGFDACPADSLCWPGASVIAGSCQTIASQQALACSAAKTLSVGADSARLAGRFNVVNLWSPPIDCSTPGSQTAPDAVVHLKVVSSVATLVISTKTPETNVATAVYLLDSCSGEPTLERCSDRPLVAPSADAELELTDVAAGDYYIIIENLDYRSGSYGLVVTAN